MTQFGGCGGDLVLVGFLGRKAIAAEGSRHCQLKPNMTIVLRKIEFIQTVDCSWPIAWVDSQRVLSRLL